MRVRGASLVRQQELLQVRGLGPGGGVTEGSAQTRPEASVLPALPADQSGGIPRAGSPLDTPPTRGLRGSARSPSHPNQAGPPGEANPETNRASRKPAHSRAEKNLTSLGSAEGSAPRPLRGSVSILKNSLLWLFR